MGTNSDPAAWSPDSWRHLPAAQQPDYPCPADLTDVLARIRTYPPLVSVGEVDKLRQRLVEAGEGRCFILQGGNCAERFLDCREEAITNQLKILLEMSVILTYGARRSVVRIGRIGGQYAKPRSQATESTEAGDLPSYRGDSVNGFESTPASRQPDPQRLLLSYYHSTATLNLIRALIEGGFADLHHPYTWNVHSIERTAKWPEYRAMLERIVDAVEFMEAFGGARPETLGRVEFYTSHEGLLLGYEEALTRPDPRTGTHYNLGAHALWIGNRTRDLGGAHVEYFRGIANPIGVKLGPDARPADLVRLLHTLNPANEMGRVMLITRLGRNRVDECLPGLVEAVQTAGLRALWMCDPMHGNTSLVSGRRKTRVFADILAELTTSFRRLREAGAHLAGVHFELTGEDVTECVGGAVEVSEADLNRDYRSYCDPQMNYAQSLEMAFLIAQMLLGETPAGPRAP